MILFKYLAREILAVTLGIVLVLLLILMTGQFLHYLTAVAQAQITISVLLKIMAIEVPLLLGYVLPLSLFLGIIIAIGRLCQDHEIVVMSACGVSHAKIMAMVGTVACFVAAFAVVLMFWVEPAMQHERIKLQSWAKASYSIKKLMPGQFQRIPKQHLVVYVGQSLHHHALLKQMFLARKIVKANHSYPHGYWQVVTAKKATQYQDPKSLDNYIVLTDGHRFEGSAQQLNVQKSTFKHYAVRLTQAGSGVQMRDRVKFMTTSALWHQRHHNPQAAELQWRFAVPISVIILALLAVPLSYVNPRHGKFGRFLPAILLYLLYMNMMFVARSWIYHGTISRSLGMWWLHILMLLIALAYTANHVGWQRFLRLGRA